ncbi:universal stress protein [Haloferula sargassicola]|uniref:UspA domain-containing protein n=1 Tax=Haloferula sargassicola TaxID=490096 RepID=A0ABP9UMR4_9BACT
MISSKPVIAGVDLSSSSAGILRHAAHIARASGSPLIAVHVVDPARLSQHHGSGSSAAMLTDVVKRSEEILTRLAETHAAGSVVRSVVLVGRPTEQFRQLVDREHAGLLVIGANDNKRKRLGPIASRCVRTVDCDVLLLRQATSADFRKVVACVDLSVISGSVIGRAIEASSEGAELDIVHVMYPADRGCRTEMLDHDAKRGAEESRESTRRQMRRTTDGFREALDTFVHETRILESTTPSVELTCHIGDRHADLVVLGTRRHSQIGAIFLDTNAERLLHAASVSVLAVRV